MILACQTSLRSDVEIEVKFDTPPKALSQPKTIEGIISSVRLLTHDIQEVSIKLNEPIPGYLAGQYAELSIPGRIEKPRSYSFATAPDNEIPGSVKFYIRHVPDGEFTSWLHGENRESHAVKVTGPYGSFWLRESDAPIICIAGGSGMAPIKALLEQLSSQGFNRRVDYLFGARTQADLYCIDDMKKIKQQGNGHFNFIPVLSREPEGSDWEGLRGNITDFILPSVSADTRNSQAYLCGPPGMIDSSIETLISAGVQKENIFYDKFLDSSHSPKR
jgi:CDP-4-dehydro-6-deoxyglucose reductase